VNSSATKGRGTESCAKEGVLGLRGRTVNHRKKRKWFKGLGAEYGVRGLRTAASLKRKSGLSYDGRRKGKFVGADTIHNLKEGKMTNPGAANTDGGGGGEKLSSIYPLD